jgi:DNA-binding winged helix-turn-helix (wHTH) protein
MPNSGEIIEFGPFRLDVGQCRLTRGETAIVLRPKVFDLLVALARNPGNILTKDELLQLVWRDTLVEESNLTVSINELRKALGDTEFIETVPKRGYRFHAPAPDAERPVERGGIFDRVGNGNPSGALPLQSPRYVKRATDDQFKEALERRESIILLKGARQVGKTSLLARGLQQAREQGSGIVLIDFQSLTAPTFETIDRLLMTFAELVCDQLDFNVSPRESWNEFLGPTVNLERFFRKVVFPKLGDKVLVCAFDEADRLFNYPYASEVFGLFRSWHNLRALDPNGPWHHLTLVFSYATEAHLFIADLNQSPFNVGTTLPLADFTFEQVEILNDFYKRPLKSKPETTRFHHLTGGHPYLTQRGLYEMVNHGIDLETFEAAADRNEGVFGDLLRRLVLSLSYDAELRKAILGVLNGQSALELGAFYRLRSAGVLAGDAVENARLRCQLFERYLKKHLA